MPEFSKKSQELLNQCHPDLIKIFNSIVNRFDCSVICGHRGEQEQNSAYKIKASTKKYPNSKHNKIPSMAVDVVPYPVEWSNTNRMRYFAGYVVGIAERMYLEGIINHKIRWGGDWDSDTVLKDQRFDDFPHFELID